ncbi:MAG: flagellar protein FlaG [Colwellia sp.]
MNETSFTSIPVNTATLGVESKSNLQNQELELATEKVNDVVSTSATLNKKEQDQSAEQKPLEAQETEHLVASLNAFVQLMDRNISFEVDTLSGRDVISVFDKETEVLIRQIPSEETLELLNRMDKVVGVLFSENV